MNNKPIELLILLVFNKIQINVPPKITTNITHKDFRWLPIPYKNPNKAPVMPHNGSDKNEEKI